LLLSILQIVGDSNAGIESFQVRFVGLIATSTSGIARMVAFTRHVAKRTLVMTKTGDLEYLAELDISYSSNELEFNGRVAGASARRT
jgi:hypothetical protein